MLNISAEKVSRQRGRPEVIDEVQRAYLRLVIDSTAGDVRLLDLQRLLIRRSGLHSLSLTTVWRCMRTKLRLSKRLGSSRNLRALQSDRIARILLCAQQLTHALLNETPIWSIDEAAIYMGVANKRRWMKMGTVMPAYHYVADIKKVTIVLAFGSHGKSLYMLVDGAATSLIYAEFISKLATYASDKLTIVQDNCRTHYTVACETVYRAVDAVDKVAATIIKPPPYSPEINPVEMVFAQLKRRLVAEEAKDVHDIVKVVKEYLSAISKPEAEAYFKKVIRDAANSMTKI